MPVGDSHNSQLSGEGVIRNEAAELRIVRISHGQWFLLLSQDINMGYSFVNTPIYGQN